MKEYSESSFINYRIKMLKKYSVDSSFLFCLKQAISKTTRRENNDGVKNDGIHIHAIVGTVNIQ